MTTYRLFPSITPLPELDSAANYVIATEFALSQACRVQNVWFYSVAGLRQLPTRASIWSITGTGTGTELASAQMSVQEADAAAYTFNSGSNTVTSPNFTPAANTLLVACFSVANGNAEPATGISLTDTAGRTWTQLVRRAGSSSAPWSDVSVWCADAGQSPTACTVTATVIPSTIIDAALVVRQFTGAAPAASQNGATGTPAPVSMEAPFTPSVNGSQVVAAWGNAAQDAVWNPTGIGLYGQNGGSAGDSVALFEATQYSQAGQAVTIGFTNQPGGFETAFAIAEIVPASVLPAWSGTPGSGWVSVPLSVSLSAASNYKVAVYNGAAIPAKFNGYSRGYWSGGVTNGPLSAPSAANGHNAYTYDEDGAGNAPPYSDGSGTNRSGQSTFAVGPPNQYPYLCVGGDLNNYWVDIEVATAAGDPGLLLATFP